MQGLLRVGENSRADVVAVRDLVLDLPLLDFRVAVASLGIVVSLPSALNVRTFQCVWVRARTRTYSDVGVCLVLDLDLDRVLRGARSPGGHAVDLGLVVSPAHS